MEALLGALLALFLGSIILLPVGWIVIDQNRDLYGIDPKSYLGHNPDCPACGHRASLHRYPNRATSAGCSHREAPISIETTPGQFVTRHGMRCKCNSDYQGVLVAVERSKTV